MSIRDAYTKWSTTYDADRNRTRDLDEAVIRQILGGQRYSVILELGCGTGKNTVLLAQLGQQVLAFDFSDGMLARAREKVSATNVTFVVADLTQPWPCDDQSVELIVCNLVLEHIHDLGFIFREAGRVLIPGGRFFISELHPFRQYQGTQANFQRDQATTAIAAFTHHISEFTGAASANGFSIGSLNEWWHEEDAGKPPRLVTFAFDKRIGRGPTLPGTEAKLPA